MSGILDPFFLFCFCIIEPPPELWLLGISEQHRPHQPEHAQSDQSLHVLALKKNRIFALFPKANMAVHTDYAEIGRVGILDAGFQQVPLVHF